jgi:hypothetical protein
MPEGKGYCKNLRQQALQTTEEVIRQGVAALVLGTARAEVDFGAVGQVVDWALVIAVPAARAETKGFIATPWRVGTWGDLAEF